MVHLNYLWGIHTLGAVAVGTLALGLLREAEAAPASPD
jgi:hypothetical protein